MSFDSSRTSSTSQGKPNKKRKSFDSSKSHQKTLGMAWGANSRSSSRSSSSKSPFSGFASYMTEKNRKLRHQFDADASASSRENSSIGSGIFCGIAIFVDGFTVPSSQELREYMLRHGGRFENYFSRQRVTHIVCSNLPDSKIKNIRSFSGGLPVVKPTWVLDSVTVNRLLDWVPYQLDQLKTPNQQTLSSFFFHKTKPTSGGAEVCKVGENNEHKSLLNEEGPSCVAENSSSVRMTERPENESSCDMRKHGPCFADDLEDELSVREAFEPSDSSPQKQSITVGSSRLGDKSTGPSPSGILGPRHQIHSTLGDPNFVENYFKMSRLHFIGTWRRRYHKRFASLLQGVKQGNSNIHTSHAPHNTFIIHIDMDCFFVSVILRKHPALQDKPVAVCHSDNPKGTAEISSANYPARDYGVRAGMFVRDAKACCPLLMIFPYDFKAYEEVADQFYDILHKHCNKVQAVSCDEAFLDITDSAVDDAEHVASLIRQEVFEVTGCTASAGIAGNMLMARLATKTAKPNGQYFISSEKVDDYLEKLPVKSLPGVGHALVEKLKSQHVVTCGDLRMISKESLQRDFGAKTGDMLWNYCRGIDNKSVEVVQGMKSIGAEVNWGVRFKNLKDSENFLVNLCKEVVLRLEGCGMRGRTITMKVKKRRDGAGEPTKYLGCGDCENLSHSSTVPTATDDVYVLQKISKQLFSSFHIDVREIRGVGLQVSRLESADATELGRERGLLRSWIASASDKTDKGFRTIFPSMKMSDEDIVHNRSAEITSSVGKVGAKETSSLPPICNLDMEVIESLPLEILSEVNQMYNGRLTDFIQKSNKLSSGNANMLLQETEGTTKKGKQPLFNDYSPTVTEVKETVFRDDRSAMASCSHSSDLHIDAEGALRNNIMPSSLSQIDVSVLQQIPEELKADIIGPLPAHRDSMGKSAENTRGSNDQTSTVGVDSVPETDLWVGNPPKWVDKFRNSKCILLNTFAELYYKSFPSGTLSSILQTVLTTFPLDIGATELNEVTCNLCELLRQYVELKIHSDIEEIYICFRLLKRFRERLDIFRQVFNSVLPSMQAIVGENYGGLMQL